MIFFCTSSVTLEDNRTVSYTVSFSQEDFLSSSRALPSQLFPLSVTRPLESVPSRVTLRQFYLLHVTVPVLTALGLTTVFIVLCSINNMWYDFIKDVLNNKK